MKKITDWALILSLSFIFFAIAAFLDQNFIDATLWALLGASGIFFLMSPQRSKDYRWNNFKILSYLFFLAGFLVCVFKYFFLLENS